MARIIDNLGEVRLNVIPAERRFDSEGDLAVHPLVAAKYREEGYDQKPKTEEEAKVYGAAIFNGLVSSCPRISVYPLNERKLVIADVAPTRYFVGQAFRDLIEEGKYRPDLVPNMSPNMAGSSLLAPVKIGGNYFLLSQIKGKALGSGEVHAALAAGNMDAVYLSTPDPLLTTLQNECAEEVGLEISTSHSFSIDHLVDEDVSVSFTYVAHALNPQEVIDGYVRSVQEKLYLGECLEVMALSLIPLEDISLHRLENGSSALRRITTFHPTVNGLLEKVEDREVRPYTRATLEHLANPENVKALLEKAGF